VARPRSPRTIHFHIYVARKHRQRYESVNDVALCGGPLVPRSRSRSVGCNDRASCVRHSLQSVAAWQQPKGTGCAQGACGQVVTGAPAGGKLGGIKGAGIKMTPPWPAPILVPPRVVRGGLMSTASGNLTPCLSDLPQTLNRSRLHAAAVPRRDPDQDFFRWFPGNNPRQSFQEVMI